MSDTEAVEETTEEAQVEQDAQREQIVEDLRADIGDGLLDHYIIVNTDLWVRVEANSWAAAAAALKGRGFDHFSFLSAIDWMPSPFGKSEEDPFAETGDDSGEGDDDGPVDIQQGYAGGQTRFQVFARFTNLHTGIGITVKADAASDVMAIDSIIPSFAGASWHERECHEMFGIGFNGHPDLRNIYLPTDFEGFPLRKDFPLLARHIKPWPGIVDVEPLPEEPEKPEESKQVDQPPEPTTDENVDDNAGK